MVSPAVVEGVGAHVRMPDPQVATGMDDVIVDEDIGSVNSSNSDDIDGILDEIER